MRTTANRLSAHELAAAIILSSSMIAATASGADRPGLGDLLQSIRTSEPDVVRVDQSAVTLVMWSAPGADGVVRPQYAISLDGRQVDRIAPASHDVRLRFAQFDPLAGAPPIAAALQAPTDDESDDGVFIVQFHTQPLEVFRRDLRERGAVIHKYVADQSYVVRLPWASVEDVAALPYVRWVGPFHAAYKLEEGLLDGQARRCNVQVFERGPGQKAVVADRIALIGGRVDHLSPDGFLLEATLTSEQVVEIARLSEVAFIDRWSSREPDMAVIRNVGGASYLESETGFTGQGVRGEVMDSNLDTAHGDFQSNPPIVHGGLGQLSPNHGTSSFGVVFGDGDGNIGARGMMPDAQGIFASYGQLSNRYTHTAQLGQSPYFASFQTNSWGNAQTTSYDSISAEMDDILFINDILVTQSQSNTGNQLSRPQAWAKNIVSIGGIRHFNTPDLSDDCWCGDASIGPAADGRIKPDLSFFNDSILTTTAGGYTNFGGTSAATPETAGHFGLFFQMWSEGLFGNPVDPFGTVFENRPHMSTAKAMLIHTANDYDFSGSGTDLARTHQGWGLPDLARLYDLRNRFLVLIDETDVLSNLQSSSYLVPIEQGGGTLRATLVYTDPSGTTSSSQHRINDLTLKVTAPDGTIYYGNNGLLSGNWSTPGGGPNTIDTVENVFIETPDSGFWTVEVMASEINEDAHVETPQVDADYALVVSVEPADNDTCGGGPIIGSGSYVVSTVGASTDGPDETAGGCGPIESDVWFKLIVDCEGIVTVDLCDADFDAQLAVYASCPADSGEALACSDDFCGQGPRISFAVSPGLYRLRVGGAGGEQGAGTINIACEPAPACAADCANQDGIVDIVDLLDLLSQWGAGASLSCDVTPVGGDGLVDIQDLLALLAAWGNCP